MHLEVKVALNFIVSYLYNKLPRRRADLFGEELERILVSRFEGHWYPEAPLRGSAFRCLHLGAPRDPVVELAAKRSGLDTEEVRSNVPAELSVWIDPYEVSYQIGEKGAVKVLYLEDPPGLSCDGERLEGVMRDVKGDAELEEAKSLCFNPDAQVFVPIGSQLSPSPTPTSVHPVPSLFNYPTSSSPAEPTSHSSNTSSPSPPYPSAQPPSSSLPAARPQPITFTTAAFAATKFGSTKMKKCSAAGSTGASSVAVGVPPVQRMLSHSPTAILAPEMLKHKSLSLSMHSLVGPIPSQLSPNAKEFVYPGSQSPHYFDADPQPLQAHAGRFQPSFDPFTSPPPSQSVGIVGTNGEISYMEKPQFVEGLGSYNLQYPSQSFQPVVLAN
ncbi:protein Tob2 [Corythoichthys intestinalis]|uniref:protein Tob2 n=1 Tax=Corythoichthys intestinalis TaxID=161448 RepID=UPI0025A63D82|nr:protein Tob2 [Corythoichthys intestinalis]XP_057673598.1 protein Tob2 [Corythoichthys intestinalis]XP_061805270.1 protein Tob2 isoform X1 [Nerophis lumbriciformis]